MSRGIHDFGAIAEADGPADHTFRFTNAGDAPLQLTEVHAACGCTTPDWTSEAVAPGATGEVCVVYDPDGRPGDFEKTVSVVAEGAEHLLTMSHPSVTLLHHPMRR